ncbi:PIN domain-containing protein [Aquibium microcysteis]|uniref:PIN domain-containing protein n=1 Tax=Aquibium microcysteis TaxID=675281 RepID=UPI00165CFF84|nr:PIN domain-containing protein [Aquibium microcysteis]
MFLLDTNIISSVARDPSGPVGRKLGEIDPDLVVTSSAVACEVRYGLAKTPASRNAARSVEFLETMTILPIEASVAVEYAKARAWLAEHGRAIGGVDLLIAAHALALGATVVTDDGAFGFVPGLKVENWLRDVTADRE